MRLMLTEVATAPGLATGTAYADQGDSAVANTGFTQIPV